MKHKSNLWVLLYCVALAFTCLSVYGYTTSPFYHEPGAGDSAIFQLIFSENFSTCKLNFDVFLRESEFHVLLLCHLASYL